MILPEQFQIVGVVAVCMLFFCICSSVVRAIGNVLKIKRRK
jgi:hypothetical protein